MKLRERLACLAAIIADEAERNDAFRRRLEEELDSRQTDLLGGQRGRVPVKKPLNERPSAVDGSRKGGRRTPSVLDPVALARQGEEVLRRDLSALDIEQLKDIVAHYGMDPGKLVMKWKDTARIIDRIAELSLARSTKGDAFRAEKTATEFD